MSLGYFHYPAPANEPVLNYGPGSKEKENLKKALKELKGKEYDIPMYIGDKQVRTGKKIALRPPHEIAHTLGHFHEGDESHVTLAIDAALAAKAKWAALSWENRAGIFLKAADLLATKYRPYINATTMLGQSKNAYQAEIDSACELIDFLRWNVHFLSEIYKTQPVSGPGVHNRTEWRPLEGFVLAITPFNFTAIAGNLPASAALCGNTVVWKPAYTQVFAAQLFMKIMRESGLPDGVINLIYVDGPVLGKVCFGHRDFGGLHFTGSTAAFNHLYKTIGENISRYRSYPRIVGETGGKDFVVAHESADPNVVATALLRGAFEYQGQKCSAASRAYIPANLAEAVKQKLIEGVKSLKMGTVEDFSNFINAVIDERSFNKIQSYIEKAKQDPKAEIWVGGECDKSKGYFVQPTVIEAKDPLYVTMCEEIFRTGADRLYPISRGNLKRRLNWWTAHRPMRLQAPLFPGTGKPSSWLSTSFGMQPEISISMISQRGLWSVSNRLAVRGAPGTNDKAGSILNLYRWLSARTIKETFVPPTDYRYPFLAEE